LSEYAQPFPVKPRFSLKIVYKISSNPQFAHYSIFHQPNGNSEITLLSRTLKVQESKVISELQICLLNSEYLAYLIIWNSPILHNFNKEDKLTNLWFKFWSTPVLLTCGRMENTFSSEANVFYTSIQLVSQSAIVSSQFTVSVIRITQCG
jgi:hypothetical protein